MDRPTEVAQPHDISVGEVPETSKRSYDEPGDSPRSSAMGTGTETDLGPADHRWGGYIHSLTGVHAAALDGSEVFELVELELQRRAEARGQSLQQYLVAELTRLTRTAPLEEVLVRIASRRGGRVGLERATEELDAERGGR